MAGARTGLITPEGFRDVLELRTLRMPRLNDLGWEKPEPLVPRYLRRTVRERIDAGGNVEQAIARRQVGEVVEELLLADDPGDDPSAVDADAKLEVKNYAKDKPKLVDRLRMLHMAWAKDVTPKRQ